jgi:hypothetical protein
MQAPPFTVALESNPDPDDVRAIHAGLEQYNLERAALTPFEPITIFVRDADNKLVGGFLGGTFWGWLHIDILWLADEVGAGALARAYCSWAKRKRCGAAASTRIWRL